jgi:hypothetical protein
MAKAGTSNGMITMNVGCSQVRTCQLWHNGLGNLPLGIGNIQPIDITVR